MNKIGLKYFLLGIIGIFISMSCKKQESDSFTIKGTLSNLEVSYFLFITEHIDSVHIDTIYTDQKGKFSHTGKINHLTVASLYFDQKPYSVSVFLNKGWNIEIKGDTDMPDLIEIEGGYINNDLTGFKKENAELFRKRAMLFEELENSSGIEMVRNYDTEIKTINFDLTNQAKEYIEKNPEKIASVILIQDFFTSNTSAEALEEFLDLLKGEAGSYYVTEDLKKYSKYIKLSQIGSRAPGFTLKNGKKEFTLKDFKDKYLLLSFSSVNETDSLGIIPGMYDEYTTLKKDSIEFLSVILSNEIKTVPDSVKWKVFYDTKGWASDVLKAYNITELPYSILISPKGRILERNESFVSITGRLKDSINIRKKE